MDESRFILIAFTSPTPVANEAEYIYELLSEGFDYVHLRHPDMSADRMSDIIGSVPPYLHPRIRLHSNFGLLYRFDLAGVQLNSREKDIPMSCNSITRSCHQYDELEDYDKYLYQTLSPIFPSISKPGYFASFDPTDLKGKVSGKRVVALGGVTEDKFDFLKDNGFIGAAMLGAIWNTEKDFKTNIRNIIKYR